MELEKKVFDSSWGYFDVSNCNATKPCEMTSPVSETMAFQLTIVFLVWGILLFNIDFQSSAQACFNYPAQCLYFNIQAVILNP